MKRTMEPVRETPREWLPHEDSALFPAQVGLLYRNAALAYTATVLNGTILAVVQAEAVELRRVLAWLGTLLVLTALRSILAWRYRRDRFRYERSVRWYRGYVLGVVAAGAVWGSAAVVLFPMHSPVHQVFVAFVLAGMSAGGVGVLSARLEVALAFLVPTLLPLAFAFLSVAGDVQLAMATMTILFMVGISITAWTLNRAITSSLSLRFDNRELVSQIEQRRLAEEGLFQERDRLATTLKSLGEGVIIADAEGLVEYLNPVAEELSGWSAVEAAQRRVREVIQVFDDQRQLTFTALEKALAAGHPVRTQSHLVSRDARRYTVEEVATPLTDRHGSVIGAVSVLRDVSDVRRLTERLAYAAHHDPLTSLPNRNLLLERLEHLLARGRREARQFGVLYLDLDRFKQVNDTMGHAAGDELLRQVGTRLRQSVRQEDTIARLGGDEFVVLVESLPGRRGLVTVREKIARALSAPYTVNGKTINVTVSIGASQFPEDGQDTHTLLQKADFAMYRWKEYHRTS